MKVLKERTWDMALTTANRHLVCTFCDTEFTPGPDYPRDYLGREKGYILTVGLVVRDLHLDGYSGIHDERAICGPMCPRCRRIVDGFFRRKGLEDNVPRL